jgi:hypothetical protein
LDDLVFSENHPNARNSQEEIDMSDSPTSGIQVKVTRAIGGSSTDIIIRRDPNNGNISQPEF